MEQQSTKSYKHVTTEYTSLISNYMHSILDFLVESSKAGEAN